MSEEKGDQEGENQLTDQSVKEEAITLLGGGGGNPKAHKEITARKCGNGNSKGSFKPG